MSRTVAKVCSFLSLSLIASLGASQASGVVYSVNTINNAGATLDLSPAKTYTHKLDFPSDGQSTAINGVQLSAVGLAGVDPLTNNAFSLTMNNPDTFNSGNSAVIQDFIYNNGQPAGAVETLTLSGLNIGTTYDARFYYRDFGTRPNTVTVNTGSGITVLPTLNQLPAPTADNYVTIKYMAESTSAVFTFAQQGPGSWHQYAVTNEVAAPASLSTPYIVQGLFNTGVSNVGVSIADNAVDPHWTLVGSGAASGITGPNAVAATSAGGFPIGPWLGDSTLSAWISPGASPFGPGSNGAALYTYSTTFTTDQAGVLSLIGRAASDNAIVAFTIDGIAGSFISGGFSSFSSFSFNGALSSGLHTVQFIVQNSDAGDGFTGFRAEFTSAIFTPIPEPASMGLLLFSMSGLALRSRRQRA